MKRGHGDVSLEASAISGEGDPPQKKIFGSKPSSGLFGSKPSSGLLASPAQETPTNGAGVVPGDRRRGVSAVFGDAPSSAPFVGHSQAGHEHDSRALWRRERARAQPWWKDGGEWREDIEEVGQDGVWIRGLPLAVREEDLRAFFERNCGPVTHVQMSVQEDGCAVVQFADAESATRAVELDGAAWLGQTLRIQRGRGRSRRWGREQATPAEQAHPIVWVGGIGPELKEQDVSDFFEVQCGAVAHVHLMQQPHENHQIAFVTFVAEEGRDAALALHAPSLGGSTLVVKASGTSREKREPVIREKRESAGRWWGRPADAWQPAPPKQDHPIVWVGGIGPAVKEPELSGFFASCCGAVAHVHLMQQPHENHQIAFVTFASEAGRDAALALHEPALGGRTLVIKASGTSREKRAAQPAQAVPEEAMSETVWVGGVEPGLCAQDVEAFFETHVGRVVAVQVVEQPHDRSNFAFVTFEDVATAQQSVRLEEPVLGGTRLKVLPSNSKQRRGAGDAPVGDGTQVFVGDVDPALPRAEVAAHFEQRCGPVEDFQDRTNDRGRYALVAFRTADAARAALGLSGTVLGDRAISVRRRDRRENPRDGQDWDNAPATTVVLVGDLDPAVPAEEVRAYFEQHCGAVVDLNDLENDWGRYALVTFETAEAARWALDLSGSVLGGRAIRVKPRRDRGGAGRWPPRPRREADPPHPPGGLAVEVGGLTDDVAEPDIVGLFQAEVGNVVAVEMHPGHCRVEFADPVAAQAATLLRGHRLKGAILEVRAPDGGPRARDARATEPCATVWVGNFDGHTAEEALRALFAERCGAVRDVEMHRQTDDRAYAFVHFEDLAAAAAALRLQGTAWGGRPLHVSYSRRPIDFGEPQQRVCREWVKGVCKFGDDCRFLHRDEALSLKDPTVWVGGLSRDATDADVRAFFEEQVGGTVSAQVRHTSRDAEGTGVYAFVKFGDLERAQQALRLSGTSLGPDEIVVRAARGTEHDPAWCPKGVCRAFLAHGACLRANCQFQHLSAAEVAARFPSGDPGAAAADDGLKVPVVWVGGLSPGTTDAGVRAFFEEQVGGTASVQVRAYRDAEGRETGMYAFVRFRDLDRASQALQLSGLALGADEIVVRAARGAEHEGTWCPKGVCREFLTQGTCHYPGCTYQHLSAEQVALLYPGGEDEAPTDPKVWVGNLPSGATEAELLAFFAGHLGPDAVLSVSARDNPDAQRRGYAFVNLRTLDAAKQAVLLNGEAFKGEPVQVRYPNKKLPSGAAQPASLLASLCQDFMAFGACYSEKCSSWHPSGCRHYALSDVTGAAPKAAAPPAAPAVGLPPGLSPLMMPFMPFPMPLAMPFTFPRAGLK